MKLLSLALGMLVAIMMGFPLTAAAQTKADDIVGVWHTTNNKAKVQIYRATNNKYYGKIIELKEPNDPKTGKPKVDSNNPDTKKRANPIIGIGLLRDFSFTDGAWDDGKIYDPENGNDYSCIMKMKDNTTLEVRGYIGFSLIGRTEVWKRVK